MRAGVNYQKMGRVFVGLHHGCAYLHQNAHLFVKMLLFKSLNSKLSCLVHLRIANHE